jgi:hypothetical protein
MSVIVCARVVPDHLPSACSVVQDHSHFDAEPVTTLLRGLGLGDLAAAFAEAEVDAAALRLLHEADLETLGLVDALSRRKLLKASALLKGL